MRNPETVEEAVSTRSKVMMKSKAELAKRAGCSREWVRRLLSRGLTCKEIIARVAKNKFRVAKNKFRNANRLPYGTCTEVARKAGCSRQYASRLLSLGITCEEIVARVAENKLRDAARQAGLPVGPISRLKGPARQKCCAECGTEFAVAFGNGPIKYCSVKCRKNANKRMNRERAAASRPLRTCIQCGVELGWHRSKFCSDECFREMRHPEFRKTQCAECGIEFNLTHRQWKSYCSHKCSEDARCRKKQETRPKGRFSKAGNPFVTRVAKFREFRRNNPTLKFTEAGIEFVAARLQTKATYPQIAKDVGICFDTFRRLMRKTPELIQYKMKHYDVIHPLYGENERNATCAHCAAVYIQYRSKVTGAFTDRTWCYKCVAELCRPQDHSRKTMSPEKLERVREKERRHYQRHKEKEQQRYREYYALHREQEIDKTRRIKAMKKYGLDRSNWREQWEAIRHGVDPADWEQLWAAIGHGPDSATQEELWNEEQEMQQWRKGSQTLNLMRKFLNRRA